MRARILAAVTATGVVAIAAVAAQATSVYKVTSSVASKKAGTRAKPVAFVPKFKFVASDSAAKRSAPPKGYEWSWNGVTVNAKDFPVCTAAQIDAAQSDKGCPKGSLVQQGPLIAVFGPSTDRNTSIACDSKTIRIYNSGPSKATWYVTGPAEGCAGVGYLPPIAETYKTDGSTTTFKVTFEDNLTHPLPGVEASLSSLDFKDLGATVTKKGKKVPYLQSNGCTGGTRTMRVVFTDSSGKFPVTTALGRCS